MSAKRSPKVTIYCRGGKAHQHEQRALGSWQPSAAACGERLNWWVSVDSLDHEYETATGSNPPPDHWSIREQTIDRGAAFERAHGYRMENRVIIRCTHPKCQVSASLGYEKFCALLLASANAGQHALPLPRLSRMVCYV